MINAKGRFQYRFGLSWWDSMIAAAVRHAACTTLLSEDRNHLVTDDKSGFNRSPVRVVTARELAGHLGDC